MMVETILESSQDFGMSNGALPQWKRELLQRRALQQRSRAPAAAPPPPPPPPPLPADEDEELRYGPGIVKRLKSRYLSLALRDAPRRRPSVLRRATSLEHLLDERPPPAPRAAPCGRAPRPASVAAPLPHAAPLARRDSVKRARSVDALSRLDSREELAPPSPSPPPPPTPPPRPTGARAGRPPRRPAPLLREAERPPPDVVRSTLRKFESAPPRRVPPAPRASPSPRASDLARRSLTPERPESAASPPPDAPPSPAPAPLSPLPLFPAPLSPRPEDDRSSVENETPPPIVEAESVATGEPEASASPPIVARGPSPARDADTRVVSRAALEGIGRAGSSVRYSFEGARLGSHLPPPAATNPVLVGRGARRVGVIRPMPAVARAPSASPPPAPMPGAVNGHSTPEPRALSRIGAAGIERAWSGGEGGTPPWGRAAARPRPPAAPATSVVFDFSDRKEVPDYIENDGIVLRSSRRTKFKAGESGVVVLRAGGVAGGGGGGSDSEAEEEADGRAPSPCGVRFVNDNVLINGRSSLAPRAARARLASLKLQFDDSLTRTHEYPSETSLCEESPTPPHQHHQHQPPPAPTAAALFDNTRAGVSALSSYTPHKTAAAAFQLGVTRSAAGAGVGVGPACAACAAAPEEAEEGRACGADLPRSWSESRALASDLLF